MPRSKKSEDEDKTPSEFLSAREIMRTLQVSSSTAYHLMRMLGPARVVGSLRLARTRWNLYLETLHAAPLPSVGPLVAAPDGSPIVYGIRDRNAAYYEAARAVLLEMHRDFKLREERLRNERIAAEELQARIKRMEKLGAHHTARALAARAAKNVDADRGAT